MLKNRVSRHSVWLVAFVSLLLAGCAGSRPIGGIGGTKRPTTTSSTTGTYNEDLSKVRPVYTSVPAPASTASRPTTTPAKNTPAKPASAEVVATVNQPVQQILDRMSEKNQSMRYAPGYRIQVFVGNQREQVEATKQLIYERFPELNAYLTYNQPTYKLVVGDFMRRTDAERYFASIRQVVKSAILQPDKVEVRRAAQIK